MTRVMEKHRSLFVCVLFLSVFTTCAQAGYNNASFSLTATPTAAYIKTPGYPRDYLSNMSYTWLIESEDVNELIMFHVEDCALEFVDAKVDVCQLDILIIYDGMYPNATKLYEGCCVPADTFFLSNSSTPYLLITFESDKDVEDRGFSIKYYNTGSLPSPEEDSGFIAFIAAGAGAVVVIVIVSVVIYLKCKKKKRPTTARSSVLPISDKAIQEGLTDQDIGQIDLIELENQIRQGKISSNRLAPLAMGANQPNGSGPKKKGKGAKSKEEAAKAEKEEKAKKAQKANGTISGSVGVGGWKEVGQKKLVVEYDENDLEELILDADGGYDIEIIDQKLIDGERLPSASLENKPVHHLPNQQAPGRLPPLDGNKNDPAGNSAPPRPTNFKNKDKKPDSKDKKKAF